MIPKYTLMKLIKLSAKQSLLHQRTLEKINDICMKHWGFAYNDMDIMDGWIDVIDYGRYNEGEKLDINDFIKKMDEAKGELKS